MVTTRAGRHGPGHSCTAASLRPRGFLSSFVCTPSVRVSSVAHTCTDGSRGCGHGCTRQRASTPQCLSVCMHMHRPTHPHTPRQTHVHTHTHTHTTPTHGPRRSGGSEPHLAAHVKVARQLQRVARRFAKATEPCQCRCRAQAPASPPINRIKLK